MMTEQVQPRLHRCENGVDLRLPRVGSASVRKWAEGLRGFVREQDVDRVAQRRETVDFLMNEMTTLVRELGRLGTPLLRMRKISGRRFVPRRRERSPEPRDLNDRLTFVRDLDERPVVDVDQILGQRARGDRVEVVVVAVNPVDRRAERVVRARLGRDVADAQPEGNLRMRRDDPARRVERAVDVSERPYLGDAGTSSSVLSQMKSLLL